MLKEKKQALRQQLKKKRAAIPETLRKPYSKNIGKKILALKEIQKAKRIFIYISYASEVETHDLMKTLLSGGKTLTVPKIIKKDEMIAVKFSDWKELKPAELGILTPSSAEPLNIDYDICLTPGLGFTESGKRIGFGAGYYDRWFSKNRVAKKIALAFEEQIIDDIPTDKYDQPVDMIVTEKRTILTATDKTN